MPRGKRTGAAVLIALAMLVSACGWPGAKGPDSTDKPPVQPPPITLMLPFHQTKVPGEERLRIVEQALGADLDIDWVPGDIYRDKMINALETNSLKMVTMVNQPDYVQVKNAIRSGMFWEIGPYLELYPNLKKLDPAILQETSVDGKIYGLFAERPASRQGIIMRKDWLDRLYLQPPGSIDELYEVMKAFTLGDPDGNGEQDTIGLTDRGDLMFGAFKTLSSYFGTPNNWGESSGKLIPEFMTQEYMDTMNFMRKLYEEKLVNPDLAVTSKQIQRYSLISGKAGIYIGSITDAPRMQNEMQKINDKAELTVVNRIRGPKGYGVWSIPGFSSMLLFSKKAIPSEEQLKRILAVFDRSMEPDVANLLVYGVMGKDYLVKNGKAVLPSEMQEDRYDEVLPFLALVIANLKNPNILETDEAGADPLTALTNKQVADNEQILIRDPAESLRSPTYDSKGAELSEIISSATYDYILGRIDAAGFQKAASEWKDKGGSQILFEYNEDYQIYHHAH